MTTDSSKQLPPSNALEHINHKILVLSGKGGVGKSTVAASLAVSLAQQGKKTGLLDVDLHGPSITQMFGLYGWPVDADEKGVPVPIEVMPKLQIVSIGMMLSSVNGGGKKLAEETGVPFLGGIPFDPEIVNCGDRGGFSGDFNHNAFAAIADKVISYVDPNNPETQKHEAEKMKIAIPTAEQKLCMHFGHCEKFALVEVNQSSRQIIKTEYLKPPMHEPGVLPKWLHEQGVNVIIAGGMGQRAQELFKQNEINVVVGAAGGSPEELINAYMNQTLETGNNVCDH